MYTGCQLQVALLIFLNTKSQLPSKINVCIVNCDAIYDKIALQSFTCDL